MLPAFHGRDPRYGPLRHTKTSGNGLPHLSIGICQAYCANRVIVELCHVMDSAVRYRVRIGMKTVADPHRRSSFRLPIMIVVRDCSEEQVRRVTTWFVVTSMADAQSNINRSGSQFPGETMSGGASAVCADRPITRLSVASMPLPAPARHLANAEPEGVCCLQIDQVVNGDRGCYGFGIHREPFGGSRAGRVTSRRHTSLCTGSVAQSNGKTRTP